MHGQQPPTWVHDGSQPGDPGNSDAAAASLSPEEMLRRQADLAELAFASLPGGDHQTLATQHLAFLPPDELALDLDDPVQCTLGDYTLLEKLGQGGMGVVYRAHQTSLDRDVAIKLLSAGPWASRDFIERFRREAQSAARMEHPNIVAIFEVGRHEELNFFSMRIVRGPSVANRLAKEGPFDPRQAALLLRTATEAVDYAHRLGVLHLDLKPGNVLIDEQGQPLVADFGLARRMDESLGHDSDEVSGTPSYMAPEQAEPKSHRLSAATDIYGLGAILYELLTGRPPFLGGTPLETLRRVLNVAPEPPRSLRKGIPADLDAICLKCLAKAPSDRYSSARALADDLARFLDGRAVSVRSPGTLERIGRWARREPRVAVAAAASALALTLGLVATTQQWRRAESNAEASQRLVWDGRREAALRLEQDGKGFEALPRLIANLNEQERAGKSTAAAMERRRLGMLLGQGATLIDRLMIADANPLASELSPDGSLLALALNDLSVRWYDTATLTERGRVSLADRSSSSGQRRTVMLLRFVDNHHLRASLEWLANFPSPDDGDTWLIDLDHQQLIEPPKAFVDFADAIYGPDGHLALLRNHQRQLQLWQVQPWRPLSALTPAQEDFHPWLLDPEGHFAAHFTVNMRQLVFHALPGLAQTHFLVFPGNAGISAWALSRDGSTLALGDLEGRAFLLDTATRRLRVLPTTRGRETTWLSFSEDDAWLAIANYDGSVHAFDVASGDSLVAGQISHEFALQRVGLSHSQRMLIATGEGHVALWRLPLPGGPRAVPALRIGIGPAPHGLTGKYPMSWSLATGLLASAGVDGQIRLWRLPAPQLQSAVAPRQIPEQTYFDGQHLVDVEWDRLRIVATTGAALTPWLQLPKPPGFAELLDGGRLLLVTTGPELRIYDAASLQLRHPPIALQASPQRLLASPDGARVLLSFGGSGPAGFQEKLQLFDARTGKRRPGEVILSGQQRHLAFSPDSTRILAVGQADSTTTVLASDGLRRIGDYPHDPFEPVIWAAFSAKGNEVLMVTRATDARLGNDSLLAWNPDSDQLTSQRLANQTRPLGVISTVAGSFVAGSNHDFFVPASASPTKVNRLERSPATAVLALSPDRRLLARGFSRAVQLYDVETADPIGPPLQSDSYAIDMIVQLAFAPDGKVLLARTVLGHWLLWPIGAERRSTAELSAGLGRLNIDRENQTVVFAPANVEHGALRALDPGPWHAAEIRPAPALAAMAKHGLAIPARAANTSSLLMDLSSIYDFAPDSLRNSFFNVRPSLRPLPVGVQRFAGTDYDVRGMAQLGVWRQDMGTRNEFPIRCLSVPSLPIAAFRLLLTVSVPSPLPTGHVVSNLQLQYVDGGKAQVPIRAGREVRGYSGDDRAVPLAFVTDVVQSMVGFDEEVFSTPRLVNPEPQRPIRCLDLESTFAGRPTLLLAITVEPANPTPGLSAGSQEGMAVSGTSVPAPTDRPPSGRLR